MRRRLAIAAVFGTSLAIALGSAGCRSGDSATERPRVSGDGYSYVLPRGWEELTGDARAISMATGGDGTEVTPAEAKRRYDTFVATRKAVRGVKANFYVATADASGGSTARSIAQQSADALADPGAASRSPGLSISYDGAPPRRISLGGEDAYFIDYAGLLRGREFRGEQLYAVHDGVAYAATFTVPDRGTATATRAGAAMIATWDFD